MAGGNAARFDPTGPKSDVLAKHWVGVDGVLHRLLDVRSSAARCLPVGGVECGEKSEAANSLLG